MLDHHSPTHLAIKASVLMLDKSQATRENINKRIIELEKEIEKTTADLIQKEDALINLKSLTDDEVIIIQKEYDKRIDKILDILDEQNSEDARNQAIIIRSLREKSDTEQN